MRLGTFCCRRGRVKVKVHSTHSCRLGVKSPKARDATGEGAEGRCTRRSGRCIQRGGQCRDVRHRPDGPRGILHCNASLSPVRICRSEGPRRCPCYEAGFRRNATCDCRAVDPGAAELRDGARSESPFAAVYDSRDPLSSYQDRRD